ncbi:hypothetical protein M378DRAFT_560015 [Amanita muscaria Koide BX008]|uniref:Uncharacterized protein n=1 Tax=Amanita muscaria (strain Koide BX008) TaxID=946122 RepID=A0A0C2WGW6_AMAMK|nr:hypothetical protein M378DRAFT_560015 [Amanita muscaria Koide BX008]
MSDSRASRNNQLFFLVLRFHQRSKGERLLLLPIQLRKQGGGFDLFLFNPVSPSEPCSSTSGCKPLGILHPTTTIATYHHHNWSSMQIVLHNLSYITPTAPGGGPSSTHVRGHAYAVPAAGFGSSRSEPFSQTRCRLFKMW